MNQYEVIKKPLVTEKALMSGGDLVRYAFVVDRRASKHNIRDAIQNLFKVNVLSVNTAIMPSKAKRVGRNIGRKPSWKKAVVTLKQGEKIDIFEGV